MRIGVSFGALWNAGARSPALYVYISYSEILNTQEKPRYEEGCSLPWPICSKSVLGVSCIKGAKDDYTNQDDFAVVVQRHFSILSVLDGHGAMGDRIANFAQQIIIRNLSNSFRGAGTLQMKNIRSLLTDTFLLCHKDAKAHNDRVNDKSEFDAFDSGSTATVVVIEKHKLTVASVGDSRCIMGVETSRGNSGFKLYELTRDHSCEREDERRRIMKAGGVIRRLDGDVPFRVFVKGKSYPGLAMTRTIGDASGEDAGLIPIPEIIERKLDPKRRSFLVLASDGVWEFLSPTEVVDIVSKFSETNVQDATDAIVKAALEKWNIMSPFAVDDITCIVSWIT
jgi:serine/threonine protein phosphatase PrpC